MAREEMFRPTADGGLELTPHGLRMLEAMRTEAAAATKKALLKNNRRLPQQENHRSLDDAAMANVTRMEAIARKTLQANPYRADADEEEERIWREVAHAARQLRPLLEALTKADDPHSEFATYGPGFRFRLLEAAATIAAGVDFDRLFRLRQRRRGNRNRPKAVSPFTHFFINYLSRNPEAGPKEIEEALIGDARDGQTGDFELSPDASATLATTDRARHLQVSGIPAAIAKAKKKSQKN